MQRVRRALAANPVCALLGPRQCGKTTLAREIAGRRRAVHVFDLETIQGDFAGGPLTKASREYVVVCRRPPR